MLATALQGFVHNGVRPSCAPQYVLYIVRMRIDDADYEEMLALFPKESIPTDPTEARQAIENFVDLVELLMKPLPLPPAGGSSFKQPSSDSLTPSSRSSPLPGSTQGFEGLDSGIRFERR